MTLSMAVQAVGHRQSDFDEIPTKTGDDDDDADADATIESDSEADE